jgi:hypothetical protein
MTKLSHLNSILIEGTISNIPSPSRDFVRYVIVSEKRIKYPSGRTKGIKTYVDIWYPRSYKALPRSINDTIRVVGLISRDPSDGLVIIAEHIEVKPKL